MQNNFYFLCQLSTVLDETLKDARVEACFSQDKDELVVGFMLASRREFWIKATLTPQLTTVSFPEVFHRARQNSVDLFKEIIDKKVVGVRQFQNERAFSLLLEEGWELLFKLFGQKANLILCREGKAQKLFHQKIHDDILLDTNRLDRPILQTFEVFTEKELATFPTFGSEVRTFLKEEGYDKLTALKEKWELVQLVLEQLKKGEFFVCNTSKGIELLLFEKGEVLLKTNHPITACNEFYYRFVKDFSLKQEKNAALRMLQKRIEQTQQYIQKSEAKLIELSEGIKNDEIGNIIMANLHQIPPRSKQVVLFDFYRNQEITIKLNETLSPQRNAENYYRKAKNQRIEIQQLQKNIEQKKYDLQAFQWHLNQLTEIDNVKELRKYLKENKLQQSSSQEVSFPFRRFHYKGFEILVGKNAANNDLLTQKYAFKEDLWLHARDVVGSHVIVKYQSGKEFPKEVIERAAEIAAYYSPKRGETLCPVIVTPKKYVRKTKDLPSGEVIIDKEEVILVKPTPP
ncbi:MAG: NFACT RNA binding domain-containing protein, partial [Flammeovirgaceae bacterium]|nr:NFACT RNA binding domain-containing protein [Flammeovirgaceae bacterium]MDW8288221.1 NFACT RNA binding domain-containing protein [Flammeovirgaceae bacterium]